MDNLRFSQLLGVQVVTCRSCTVRRTLKDIISQPKVTRKDQSVSELIGYPATSFRLHLIRFIIMNRLVIHLQSKKNHKYY